MATTTTGGRTSSALVTGGAGFIGRSIVEALTARGWRVRVADLLSSGRQRQAAAAMSGVDVVGIDLSTAPLRELLLGVDAVVHLAGRPGVQPSWGSGFDEYVRHNVTVTQRLLEVAGGRRVVVASSSSVYGEIASGAASEDAPLRPLSPYGVSKVTTEMLVHAYAARGVDAVALRYFSVYGRHQRPDMAVSRLLGAVSTGRPFTLRGDGSQQRDLTHVDDVVAATLAAIEAPLTPGAVVNIGSGRPVSLRDVIAEVERQTGRAVPVERVPTAPGDPGRTAADRRRALAELGWAPRVALADGIADQLAAHRAECAYRDVVSDLTGTVA
ncbi:MAG: NAD-dependent epimerase/dehydratase family protein [Ilumatobacteraceae bacterium]